MFEGGRPRFVFLPVEGYADPESYRNNLEWVNSQRPMSFRELCRRSEGWETFYASHEMFCIPCPVNRLVRIPVPLTDVASQL